MRVLVACEESQVVTLAFRKLGHTAFSCDIEPCSGGHPEYHYQQDVRDVLERDDWNLIIAFPPCTHLSSSGARWWKEKQADGRQQAAIDFFMLFAEHPARFKAIENPVGIISSVYRKPDQIIQPWQFGHGEVKTTCLWLYGLPPLKSTRVVKGREQRVWKMGPSPERAKLRSKTYPGIARAMARQWGPYVEKRLDFEIGKINRGRSTTHNWNDNW